MIKTNRSEKVTVYTVEGIGVIVRHRRKDNFDPYTEPFRPLNDEEVKSITRMETCLHISDASRSEFLVSYQAITGGFTICNIFVNGRLFTGSSRCSKVDRWLPIRGKMNAFRRALQSEGVELRSCPEESTIIESMTRGQFLKEFITTVSGVKKFPRSTVDQIISSLNSLKEEKANQTAGDNK